MKLTTRRIAFAGILAALYAVITYLCMPFAYGSIQFRLSEALSVLCCFTPVAIVGMVVGCVVANIFTTLSFPVIDIVFGSLATFLACLITWKMSKRFRESRTDVGEPWERKANAKRDLLLALLIPLPTVLCNAVIVGAEIAWFFAEGEAFWPAFVYNFLTVGAGEAAVMYALGVPLLLWLRNNDRLSHQLRVV